MQNNPPGNYVLRGGLDVLPAPWRCDNATLYAFYVAADLDALQGICDRCLNNPSGGALNYKPLTHYVVLSFQQLEGLYSTAPGYESQGRMSYPEATFWIIVEPYDRNGDPAGEAAMLVPYIFADNGLAVATGREVYGYPKQHAAIVMPQNGASADFFSVSALAVRRYGADAQIEPATEILRCERTATPELDAAAHAVLAAVDHLPDLLKNGVAGSPFELMRAIIEMCLTGQANFVFLRELRAAGGGAGSDYQAVMSATQDDMSMKSVNLLPGDYRLTLPPLDSHPIAADFGFTMQEGNQVEISMGIRYELGFTLEPGKPLWPPA